MTDQYLRSTTADYITGVVSACEGIKDSLVLTNGPLGCKFYHGYSAGQSLVNSSELWGLRGELMLSNAMSDKLLRSQYFAGTAQNPGTNLRYEDNIFGTREQLHRALNDIFSEKSYEMFTVIQSPGTSLLGEDMEDELKAISKDYGLPYLFIESPVFSDNLYHGYDETMVKLLSLLCHKAQKKKKRKRPSVNLFGLYTYDKYLEGNLAELIKLLDLCGIDLQCVAGCNCKMESFRDILQADAHILLSAERTHMTRQWLEKESEVPILDLACMPIGFDLTENFVKKVCSLFALDPSPALSYVEEARARAFYFISRHLGPAGFPGQLRYALEGECSLLYAFCDYLTGYLGISASCLHILYEDCKEYRENFLEQVESYDLTKALDMEIIKVHDAIVIGSAYTIMEVTNESKNIFGIEITNPSSGYVHVVPKSYAGASGALYLLEQLINGNRLINSASEIHNHWLPTLRK